MLCITVEKYGTPDQLQWQILPTPTVEPDQVLVKVKYAGVNFVDIYERSGVYSTPLPLIPGKEGVGEIVAMGSGVKAFHIGQRVGFPYMEQGAYGEYIALCAYGLVSLPESISDEVAASVLLQGLTALFLSHETFPLNQQHTVLIHAAAGGVGFLLVQMAKLRGARVIGTVSSAAKALLAFQAGADKVIRYDCENFVDGVMDFTAGQGVDVVYDSVGLRTFEDSLKALKNRGLLVACGQASGEVPPVALNRLLGCRASERGSFYLTRPVIRHYISDAMALKQQASLLFDYLSLGKIQPPCYQIYSLEQAKEAHYALESRQVTGKLLLSCS
ncbi:MAG: quinone oxidoreductase family protein [Microcystis panniformis]